MKLLVARRDRLLLFTGALIAIMIVGVLGRAQGTSGPGRNKMPDINQMVVMPLPPPH